MFVSEALEIPENLLINKRVRPDHRSDLRLEVSCLKQMPRFPGDCLAKFNQAAGYAGNGFFAAIHHRLFMQVDASCEIETNLDGSINNCSQFNYWHRGNQRNKKYIQREAVDCSATNQINVHP